MTNSASCLNTGEWQCYLYYIFKITHTKEFPFLLLFLFYNGLSPHQLSITKSLLTKCYALGVKSSLTYHGHRGEYSQALSLYKGRDNNKKLNYSEGDTDSSAPSRNNHSCLYYEQRQEWGITKPSFVGQVMSPSCRRWEGRGRHKGFISTNTVRVTAVCSAQVRRSETVQ